MCHGDACRCPGDDVVVSVSVGITGVQNNDSTVVAVLPIRSRCKQKGHCGRCVTVVVTCVKDNDDTVVDFITVSRSSQG